MSEPTVDKPMSDYKPLRLSKTPVPAEPVPIAPPPIAERVARLIDPTPWLAWREVDAVVLARRRRSLDLAGEIIEIVLLDIEASMDKALKARGR